MSNCVTLCTLLCSVGKETETLSTEGKKDKKKQTATMVMMVQWDETSSSFSSTLPLCKMANKWLR